MASARVIRAVMERGPLGAFEQFFKLRTFKFGRLVGVDRAGNHYYENTEEYKHGALALVCYTPPAAWRALAIRAHAGVCAGCFSWNVGTVVGLCRPTSLGGAPRAAQLV